MTATEAIDRSIKNRITGCVQLANDWQHDPAAVMKFYRIADYVDDVIRSHDTLRWLTASVMAEWLEQANRYDPEIEASLLRSWKSLHDAAQRLGQSILPVFEASQGPVENAAKFRRCLAWMNQHAADDYNPEAEQIRRRSTESIVEMLGLTV